MHPRPAYVGPVLVGVPALHAPSLPHSPHATATPASDRRLLRRRHSRGSLRCRAARRRPVLPTPSPGFRHALAGAMTSSSPGEGARGAGWFARTPCATRRSSRARRGGELEADWLRSSPYSERWNASHRALELYGTRSCSTPTREAPRRMKQHQVMSSHFHDDVRPSAGAMCGDLRAPASRCSRRRGYTGHSWHVRATAGSARARHPLWSTRPLLMTTTQAEFIARVTRG